MKRLFLVLASVGLAAAPVAAQTAAPLSVAGSQAVRASASMDGSSEAASPGTMILLGLLLLVAIGAVVTLGGDEGPSSP